VSRLGRNLRDTLETLEYFTDKGIDIYIENQGLHTMLPNGKTNPTALLIISLLGAIAEQERNLLIERTREGVAIAHANGKYKGRKLGAVNTSEEYERRFGRTICVVQPLFNEGRSVNYVSDFLKQQNTFLDKTTKFKGASRITLEKLIRIGLLTKPTK
jgi:DNA invertase Pin-like site-specific DNA recombinase